MLTQLLLLFSPLRDPMSQLPAASHGAQGGKRMAKECWQQATGQKEDASILNAANFVLAGASAAGLSLKLKYVGEQD